MQIRDYFNDAGDLLALPPHELAEYVLKITANQRQNKIVHPQVWRSIIQGEPAMGRQGYAQHLQDDVLLAVAEAWSWLLANGLLIPDFGMNGTNGWVRLSRRAEELVAQDSFGAFRRQTAFPRALLHSSIADDVWSHLMRDQLDTAVFIAFRQVEISVRAAGKYPDTDYGVALMRAAFQPTNGPLTDKSKPIAERDALAQLFAGAIGSYKNPTSHRTVAISDPAEAQEMVLLASHLLRIVDSRGSTS